MTFRSLGGHRVRWSPIVVSSAVPYLGLCQLLNFGFRLQPLRPAVFHFDTLFNHYDVLTLGLHVGVARFKVVASR